MTSKIMTLAPVGLAPVGRVPAPKICGQVRERDVREASAQERIGFLQGAVEGVMDCLFDQATRVFGSMAQREQQLRESTPLHAPHGSLNQVQLGGFRYDASSRLDRVQARCCESSTLSRPMYVHGARQLSRCRA